MPVQTMLSQMSSAELTMWQAFFPAANERADAARQQVEQERAITGE